MKSMIIVAAATFFSGIACYAQTKPVAKKLPATVKKIPAPTASLKNSTDSFSYAAGVNIANSMKGQGIKNINSTIMARAMNDVFTNSKKLLTDEQSAMTLQEKLQQFAEKKAGSDRAVSTAFFVKNKAKPGVIALPNGLQYEVLKPGNANGKMPRVQDTVVVHYVGTTTDGKEFDNSIKRGEPATFPLGGVIRGWTEILQLMPVGSKWRVYIPSELGYGDRGAGAAIPPNAILIFEIELLEIKPAI